MWMIENHIKLKNTQTEIIILASGTEEHYEKQNHSMSEREN